MSRKRIWLVWLIFIIAACVLMALQLNKEDSIAYSPVEEPKRILIYGDEYAMGKGASSIDRSFPVLVAKKIGWEFDISAKIDHNSMTATADLLNAPIPRGKYGIVLLMLGMNDSKFDMPYETTASRMGHLFELLYSSGAMVVYGHIAPESGGWTAQLQKLAAKSGWSLVVENILRDVRTNPRLMADERFPNDAGHEIIADRIYSKILPHIKK